MGAGSASQSPDGDFFDPEQNYWKAEGAKYIRHSPLTGIFLIRRNPVTVEGWPEDLVTVP